MRIGHRLGAHRGSRSIALPNYEASHAVDGPMPNLTIPLTSAVVFIGIGWLIVHAGEQHADAIRHTLSVFVLVLGLLALIGVIAELRAGLGVDRMSHRVEARSQADAASPARIVRKLDAGLNP